MTIPAVTPLGPNVHIDPLGRPVISVANQAIVLDAPFEVIETLTLNTDVGIGFKPQASAPVVDLASIEPAAGGNDNNSVEDLANIEPAAGGPAEAAPANGDVGCANNFLDNRPCELVQ